MADALVGHSGFVGGHLKRQARFDHFYRSTDIEEIRGRSYELLVCAGAPAAKWTANREPAQDLANLERLMSCLGAARVSRCVLISTVDVYPEPSGTDEDTPIDPDAASAYGRHRFMLEEFLRRRFETTIVRLPGLFGTGLKKNIVYDLLHDNRSDQISPESQFQFYDLENLWRDATLALEHRLPVIHFATQPTTVREVAREAFGMEFENPARVAVARYDLRSKHAGLYGGRDGYLYDKAQVLGALRAFVRREREQLA